MTEDVIRNPGLDREEGGRERREETQKGNETIGVVRLPIPGKGRNCRVTIRKTGLYGNNQKRVKMTDVMG